MTRQASTPASTFDSLAFEQAAQDRFIRQRLPTWLLGATERELDALGVALRESLKARQQVKRALADIQPVEPFVRALLEPAMSERFGAGFDLDQWTFRSGRRGGPVINAQPVGAHLSELVYGSTTLLEAALRNFTAAQTRPGGHPEGNRLETDLQPKPKAPSASAFATLCRDVDAGGLYQRHLKAVSEQHALAAQLATLQRWDMLVDAYKAKCRGVLSEPEWLMVEALCRTGTAPDLQGAPVVVKQLRVLGCDLEQIVVLDVIDVGLLRNSSQRVLVYIPGDPDGPWSAHDNLLRFARTVLGQRLRKADYRAFFRRFVRRRDSQRFFAPVIEGYRDLAIWANIDLDEHIHAYALPVFDTLGSRQVKQIRDDAAMIAVPVADLDRQVQAEHDQRLASEGWTLLNLAGFFVPAIGAALLAITAWQLLGEVFHGIEAWHEGDDSEALEHVLNVGKDVAAIAVTAVGVGVASRVWQRSGWVDSLVPARLASGVEKLWDQNLVPYRGEPPLDAGVADALGVRRLGEQAWIEMDGQQYSVQARAEDGGWQLAPQQGLAPELLHNGDGAWRLRSEQPAQWADTYRLFRRLGTRYGKLDDEQIDEVLTLHGLSADHLRAWHMEGRRVPFEVTDSVVRIRLDQHIRRLVSQLRSGQAVDDATLLARARALEGAAQLSDQALAEWVWQRRRTLLGQLHEGLQASSNAGVQSLRRMFPQLPRRAASALVRAAHVSDRQRLLDEGRVPLRLAEAARAVVRRVRVARVYEALRLDTPQNADLARVVIGLLRFLPGEASTVRWQLLQGDLGRPLPTGMEQGSQVANLLHEAGAFRWVDAAGTTRAGPGELFEVMAVAYGPGQRDALEIGEPFAHNLRVMIGHQALQRRETVEQLLDGGPRRAWFRAPRRLEDGRIGYPLSGRSPGANSRRGRPQALFVRVRAIYPGFNDAQVLAWLTDMHDAGRPIEAELTRLARELELLQQHLQRWCRRAASVAGEDERRFFADSLVNCWQRRTTVLTPSSEGIVNYRFTLYAATPGGLPELPADVSFAHVHELGLMEMGLRNIPEAFMRAFPNLRVLELSGNRLRQLPANLEHLQALRELDLSNNRIVLDAPQVASLANCMQLEYLNLSFNPLGRAPSVIGLGQLRRLLLSSSNITVLPPGLLDSPELLLADLRDNRIHSLPERFYRAPQWIRRIILLAGNPLSEAHSVRLRAALPQEASLLLQQPNVRDFAPARQRWLDAMGSPRRPELSSHWELMETEPGAGDFYHLLGRLLDSADFRQNPQYLAGRVFRMLEAMHGNASLREQIFSQVSRDLTCQDSAALAFSNLEVSLLAWRARLNAASGAEEQALMHLGQQLWRLDEVDRIALEDIRQRRAGGGNPDEIEVVLAYRLALRETLDLPLEPSDMLFAEVAGLTPQRISAAREQVLARENPDSLAQSIVDQSFWQEHLQQTERSRLEALDAPYHARIARLMDSDTVPEGERVAQMEAAHTSRQWARRSLMLELTLAILNNDSSSALR